MMNTDWFTNLQNMFFLHHLSKQICQFVCMRSRLELVLGPMFAGKSSELIRRARRAALAGQRVLVINHSCDVRYGCAGSVTTHDQVVMTALSTDRLADVDITNAQVVAIDEGQFFNDIQTIVCGWLERYNCTVIIAALDGTAEREPFGSILSLLPHTDRVDKLVAVCSTCGADAPFTRRVVARTSETDPIHVGGLESYRPTCRKCFVE